MALKFKAIQKAEPGVAGGGKKKYYASVAGRDEQDITKITRAVEKISTVSGADIRAVLYAAADVIPDFLADGDIVRLGDLGSFRLTLSSEGVNTEEEAIASIINGARIIFTPGEKLKEMLNNLDFQKVK
jgi:predicted histone-like DNA-binding protein